MDERYHGVHTGRGNVGLCVGLCLRTSLMYDVCMTADNLRRRYRRTIDMIGGPNLRYV